MQEKTERGIVAYADMSNTKAFIGKCGEWVLVYVIVNLVLYVMPSR